MRNISRMRILPVIDLMNGLVVRGVGGRRDEYRPIVSQIAADALPLTVAQAFIDLGLREIYLADLDAIAGHEPAWDIYHALMERDIQLWLDAGLTSSEQVRQLARFHCGDRQPCRIIAGLESIEHAEQLGEWLELVGPSRFVFSLDLRAGKPITRVPAWQDFDAVELARSALNAGVKSIIVLDLVSVGEEQGVSTATICRQIHELNDQIELVSGGGVRDRQDLEQLAHAGCHAVLVASALHNRRLP